MPEECLLGLRSQGPEPRFDTEEKRSGNLLSEWAKRFARPQRRGLLLHGV